MYVLTSNFDADTAVNKVSELLALGEAPERLAEKLNFTQDLPRVQEGIKDSSFKRLIADVEKLKQYLELGQKIEKVKAGQGLERFLGSGFAGKKIDKLEDQRRKIGSLFEPPRWFYKHPRVWLLGAVRDYALDTARHHDSDWINTEEDDAGVQSRSILMFESGDVAIAKDLVAHLEKPFKEMDPRYILENLDGHRSFIFHFSSQFVTYFQPLRES